MGHYISHFLELGILAELVVHGPRLRLEVVLHRHQLRLGLFMHIATILCLPHDGFRDQRVHEWRAVKTHAADDMNTGNVADLAFNIHVLLELLRETLNVRLSLHESVIRLLLVVLPQVIVLVESREVVVDLCLCALNSTCQQQDNLDDLFILCDLSVERL